MLRLVAHSVTPFALSALKYGLFALLLLFIWRAMRWAVRGLSVETATRSSRRAARKGGAAAAEPAVPPGPSAVVIHAEGAEHVVAGWRRPDTDLLVQLVG